MASYHWLLLCTLLFPQGNVPWDGVGVWRPCSYETAWVTRTALFMPVLHCRTTTYSPPGALIPLPHRDQPSSSQGALGTRSCPVWSGQSGFTVRAQTFALGGLHLSLLCSCMTHIFLCSL